MQSVMVISDPCPDISRTGDALYRHMRPITVVELDVAGEPLASPGIVECASHMRVVSSTQRTQVIV